MERGNGSIGKLGEDLACDFLESRGQRILERNWRSGHLEIDIISEDGRGVHFVEVKSRVAPVAADPEENVRAEKQRRVTSAALRYLHGAGKDLGGDAEVFFDIVTVVFDGGRSRVSYFPQAWIPTYV